MAEVAGPRFFDAKVFFLLFDLLFERLLQSFQRKSSCFWRTFIKSLPAFGECFESLLSESFQRVFREISESLLSLFTLFLVAQKSAPKSVPGTLFDRVGPDLNLLAPEIKRVEKIIPLYWNEGEWMGLKN